MSHRTQIGALALTATILVAGVVAVACFSGSSKLIDSGNREAQPQTHRLAPLLDGYSTNIKLEQIPTDDVRRQVGANETLYLRCTDRTSGFSHELYVAYWRPGNLYCFESVLHPPDICWSGSGWYSPEGRSDVVIPTGTSPLGPVEWRKFIAQGATSQEVAFWCMNGNRRVILGNRTSLTGLIDIVRGTRFFSSVLNWIRADQWFGAMERGWIPAPAKHDVFFLRFNSHHPIDEVVRSEAFQVQLAQLSEWGLLPSAREDSR